MVSAQAMASMNVQGILAIASLTISRPFPLRIVAQRECTAILAGQLFFFPCRRIPKDGDSTILWPASATFHEP